MFEAAIAHFRVEAKGWKHRHTGARSLLRAAAGSWLKLAENSAEALAGRSAKSRQA